MVRVLAAAMAALLLTACVSQPAPSAPAVDEQAALAEDGRDIAEAQCSGCHAVGPYGESPNAAAPPFRSLLSQYHADVLEEELINGIRVAHPMPAFQFNPQGVDALIAYLRSVQQPQQPAQQR
ncbi:c-type cytochrome [Terricaulis sp.]|uniref:c-type cytochrome n=1 Tax=Terricaulis sp. TaxID=2768686 RepID=UPI0037848E07